MSTTLLNNINHLSLAETLTDLIDREIKLTPAALARKLGIPTNKITRILNGDVTDPKASTLLQIANYFGITIEQLLGVEPIVREGISQGLTATQALPIFELSHPEKMTKEWYRWVPNDIAGDYFTLALDTDLYEPTFPQNSLLIINRDVAPDDRSYILIKKTDNAHHYLIKKYVQEGDQSYLYPINPQDEVTELELIIGLMIFCFLNLFCQMLCALKNDSFRAILHNQARMFIASATAFFLGMTINSTVISIIKSRQRKRGISLKRRNDG